MCATLCGSLSLSSHDLLGLIQIRFDIHLLCFEYFNTFLLQFHPVSFDLVFNCASSSINLRLAALWLKVLFLFVLFPVNMCLLHCYRSMIDFTVCNLELAKHSILYTITCNIIFCSHNYKLLSME